MFSDGNLRRRSRLFCYEDLSAKALPKRAKTLLNSATAASGPFGCDQIPLMTRENRKLQDGSS
jgi:hypothetical protein